MNAGLKSTIDPERLAQIERDIRELQRQVQVLFENVGRVATVIKTEQVQEAILAETLKEVDAIKAVRNRAGLTVLPGKDSDGDKS